MPLAGAPRDLYMQLLACSSSQSVVAIACFACQFVLWFCLLAVSACTMTACRTNNSLAATLDGENLSSDSFPYAESSGLLSLAFAANLEPQKSPVVAAGGHDPALIAVIVHAVMALLAAEKGPGPSSSNLHGNSLSVEPQAASGGIPAPPPSLLQQTVSQTFLNSGGTFPGNRQYLQLQPRKVGLILLCHPLLPLLQPRTR